MCLSWLAGCFPSPHEWWEQPSHGTRGHSRPQGRAVAAWGEPTRLHPRSGRAFRTSPAGWMLPAVVLLPAACPGEPWRGWIRSPTLHLAQAAWAARAVQAAKQVLGGRGGPWWPRRSSAATFVAPGFSLGNFQHCSFRFSAAGEEAYGCLKGINDA